MAPPKPEPNPGSAPLTPRQRFDAAFRAIDQGGRVMSDCYLAAFGDEALEDADPYSAIALSELRWLVETAGLGAGKTLVDLGCGRGGPGLVAARWTGVRLIGVDFSLVGVTRAATRAVAVGLAPSPSFICCDARALPFADHSIDAVLSIDVLQLIPDRELVLEEVARVLRPGGALAFSSWELIADDESVPPRMRSLPRDYTASVGKVHLRMEALQVPEGSRQRIERFWANASASADEIRSALGEEVATRILDESARTNVFLDSTRRVLCVARSQTV